MGDNQNVVCLQGSASYLLQKFKMAGRPIKRDDLDRACQYLLADALASDTPVRCREIANAIMCRAIIKQFPEIPYFFSARELLDPTTGANLSTSLWAGLKDARSLRDSTWVLDVGTSEVKFHCGTKTRKADAAPFYAVLDKYGPDVAAIWLDGFAAGNPDRVMIGTAALRTKPAVPGVEVLSQEDEAAFEFHAISSAIKLAEPAALNGYSLKGNIAWGGGSAQGVVNGRPILRSIGLNHLLAAMKTTGGDHQFTGPEFSAAVAAAVAAATP